MGVAPHGGFTLDDYHTDGVISGCLGSCLMVLFGCTIDKAIWRALQLIPSSSGEMCLFCVLASEGS